MYVRHPLYPPQVDQVDPDVIDLHACSLKVLGLVRVGLDHSSAAHRLALGLKVRIHLHSHQASGQNDQWPMLGFTA